MGLRIPYERTRTIFLNGGTYSIRDSDYRVLQSQMFLQIWSERKHICAVSGNPLTVDAKSYYFHHILEKRMYELYGLCKWNIVILSWDVHNAYESNPIKVPELHELRRHLLECIDDSKYHYDNDEIWCPGDKELINHIAAITGKVIVEQLNIKT